jgi:hypothetical protein
VTLSMSLTTKARRPMGCGKSRSVESEENQKQVFLPSHRPWKSRTTRGIPTFPTAPTAAGISQTTSGSLIVVERKEYLTPDNLRTAALVLPAYGPCIVLTGMYYAGQLGIAGTRTFADNYVPFSVFTGVVTCIVVGIFSFVKTKPQSSR